MFSKNRIFAVTSSIFVALPLTLGMAAPAMASSLPPPPVGLFPSPLPSCNDITYVPSPAEKTIVGWYGNFLGISPVNGCDKPERFSREAQMIAGASPQYVLSQIVRTPEYAKVSVNDAYSKLLKRKPDSGSQYWKNGIQKGMALEWVHQNILASPEYFSKHDNNYIMSLYGNVLGRDANAGEIRYWNNRIAAVGNFNVVREIWYSPEGVRYRINDNYVNFLKRTADEGEINYWYNQEAKSDVDVKIQIASSKEYKRLQDKLIAPDNGRFGW